VSGIYDALSTNPRTKAELAERTGWTKRDVELAIQAARLDGAPIASSQDGYWLTLSPQTIRECAERLRHRIRSQYRTWRALRSTARRLDGVELERLWSDVEAA
jgi:biotin operon repressor